MKDNASEILEKIRSFVAQRENIRLAVMIGSQARSDRPADEWSDLDIGLVTTSPETYLDSADWLREIGDYSITFLERTASGAGMERRVLFHNGVDVDFSVVPFSRLEEILRNGFPQGARPTASRGAIVLDDKDHLWAKYKSLLPPQRPADPPTETAYLQSVNDFLYHWVWTARKLRRGELWVALDCCDDYMKGLLLEMLQWYTHSLKGWDYETWHSGRFLEEWADPNIVRDLEQTFAHYSKRDVQQALTRTVELYERLAKRVAAELGFQYPRESAEHAQSQVQITITN